MNIKLDVRKLLGFRLDAARLAPSDGVADVSVSIDDAQQRRLRVGIKRGVKQGFKVGRKTSPLLGLKRGDKRGMCA